MAAWRVTLATPALARFNPAQPGAAGHEGRRHRPAGGDGGDVRRRPRSSSRPIRGSAYVKAFAEAAMVGGLADWFAVTALFRHPLGLPIPHTAIIPRNKDRIGEALANFLKENFLIAPVVARRMRNIDLAGAAGRFLQAPRGRRNAHPPRRLAADRRHVRKPRRRAARRPRQGRDLLAHRKRWRSRRCSATRSPRRSTRIATCRCSRRRSAGWRGRSTPTRG